MYYQKYRPKNFDEVFGNKAIVESLKQGVTNGNLPHAMLFYGPRGTGKTTTARLLAKILVCENRTENGDACAKCPSCLEVANGNYPDVYELDAASNNSVENVRAINERISLSPSRGKIKMYIIDEVHMLSKGAFNALLKTLEEPPHNTYFVLATTELDKVIDTVKSRCTVFEFKRASNKDIIDKLKYIVSKEKLKVAENDLKQIAAASKGGFRDAETLLESMVIGSLSADEVLNSAGADFIVRLFDGLLDNNLPLSIELIDSANKSGKNLESLNKEILFYLRQILLLKNSLEDLSELDETTLKLAKDQSLNFSNPFLLKCLKAFNSSLEQIKYAYIPTLPLEVAVLEIIGQGGTDNFVNRIPKEPVLPIVDSKTPDTSRDFKNTKKINVEPFKEKNTESTEIKTIKKEVKVTEKEDISEIENSGEEVDISKFEWESFLQTVEKEKPSLSAILNAINFKGFKGNNLLLEARFAFHKERLEFTSTKTVLLTILRQITGGNCNIKCILLEKAKENLTDKNVEYITVSESDLPIVSSKPKADDFSVPVDDESFVASAMTIEQQLKKMAKEVATTTKDSNSEALDSFSGDFSV